METRATTNHIQETSVRIKVCGMGTPENILEVATLQPDYLGFIFYKESTRNFQAQIPEISSGIKKTGVFVDATLDFIIEKTILYEFQAVQLHGEETAVFCKNLRKELIQNKKTTAVEIIKVFSIKDNFDFGKIQAYEAVVDFFLFDTKGKNKGGNGYTFDWTILKDYKSNTPFFLSGGIGIEELENIKELISYFRETGRENLLYAVDVNSKFEISPKLKDVAGLRNFRNGLLEKGD